MFHGEERGIQKPEHYYLIWKGFVVVVFLLHMFLQRIQVIV